MSEKVKAIKDSKNKTKYLTEHEAIKSLIDDEFKDIYDRLPVVALLAQILKTNKNK